MAPGERDDIAPVGSPAGTARPRAAGRACLEGGVQVGEPVADDVFRITVQFDIHRNEPVEWRPPRQQARRAPAGTDSGRTAFIPFGNGLLPSGPLPLPSEGTDALFPQGSGAFFAMPVGCETGSSSGEGGGSVMALSRVARVLRRAGSGLALAAASRRRRRHSNGPRRRRAASGSRCRGLPEQSVQEVTVNGTGRGSSTRSSGPSSWAPCTEIFLLTALPKDASADLAPAQTA